MQSFISVQGHGYLFYDLGHNLKLLDLFYYSNISRFGHGKLLFPPMSFQHSPTIVVFVCCFFFQHFLTFWSCNMLQDHHVCFLPQSQMQPFLQELQFLLLENGISKPRSGCQALAYFLNSQFTQYFFLLNQEQMLNFDKCSFYSFCNDRIFLCF